VSPAGRGVLYIATGAAHLGAARASAASVRRSNPGLAIAVFTDVAEPAGAFDLVIPVKGPHDRSKTDYMHRSPFAETLYLDGDTRVFGRLDDLFRLLERFDLALAHVARFWGRGYQAQWSHQVPASFPQLNTGVMLFRGTPEVLDLLAGWPRAYEEAAYPGDDQLPFRQMVWLSDLRLAVLPSIYNARRYTWIDRLFSKRPPPVILHTNLYHPSKGGTGLRRWLRRAALPPIPSAGG
jgi:hypothetical protein